jgi:hypothetical protein
MKAIINIFILGVLITISGCTKNLEDLNNDPNRPKSVTPGVMLGQLQYRVVSSTIRASRNFTHELMQVDAPRSSPSGLGLHRYVVNPGAALWTPMYSYLTDVEDIIRISKELKEDNYRAIALIYRSWIYSLLTDAYGDVPFTDAIKATQGVLLPKFDSQKNIYIQILKDLDTANAIINTTKALTYGGDQVYNANVLTSGVNTGMVKWRRFANSLRLRLLLRIIKRDGELPVRTDIQNILANPVTNPIITSNVDEAIFRFPGTFPYFNPYFNERQLEWRDGTYFTTYFLNRLNADNDPRRAIWARTITVNGQQVYRGIESGYPSTVEYQVGANSSYNDAMKTASNLGVMLTYSEVEFILAELALRGFNTGKTPKQHYENGINASMIQWGVTLPTGFLTQPTVAFNDLGTFDNKLEQVMMQKYIAYFFVDYQSWFEKRRTGYPVLPRGTGIPAANVFPSRSPYPTYLQSLNAANLNTAISAMGGDNSTIKVWWEN